MNQEYYDEQYEDWDEYDDYDDEWDYDGYYEPYEPPTRWQRVKAWFNTLWWRISSKFRKNEWDDIPF